MRTETAILFENIPSTFKYHEKVYVMQYEFSGIQSFIFGDVTLSSTREDVRKRSEYVVHATEDMEKWLRGQFGRINAFRVLSKSSGKLICAVSRWTRITRLNELSEELQRNIYATTDGKLEMFYGLCEAIVMPEKESSSVENVMGRLADAVNKNKYHCTNILNPSIQKNTEILFSNPECIQKDYTEAVTNSVMAAIKLDLDNLGSFFQKLSSFDARKRASECLENVLKDSFEGISNAWPVFVGGDDIFAVSDIEHYLAVIAKVYEKIRQQIESMEALSLYRDKFGISGGVSFIRKDLGRVPLVYYYEQSEEKLEQAKSISGKNVIAIMNSVLSWEQLETISAVFLKNRDDIMRGLNEHQIFNLYFNIGELKSRIMRVHKSSGSRLLTQKEIEIVYNVH